MPRVPLGKRKRAFKPKTRTGCITCKIRRVKCDETKPSCLKCTSTGRACDGYVSPSGPRNQSPVSTVSSCCHQPDLVVAPYVRSSGTISPTPVTGANNPSSLLTITQSPSVAISPILKESRSFYYFLDRTISQLTGLYGSEFWERYVPQAAHYSLSIRRGIIALGALHEVFENTGMLTDLQNSEKAVEFADLMNFALRQYNLAIRTLLESSEDTKDDSTVDTYLIACVIFACFEMMQGRYGASVPHVKSGTKILCNLLKDSQMASIRPDESKTKLVPIESFIKLLTRLDWQVTMMIGGERYNIYEHVSLSPPTIPDFFTSVSEARDALEHCLYLFSIGESERPHTHPNFIAIITAAVRQCTDVLKLWSKAFDNFLAHRADTTPLNSRESAAAAVLQIYRLMSVLILDVEHSPEGFNECRWDAYMPEFRRVIELAEEVVTFITTNSTSSASLSIDSGIVSVLYGVASHCRDPIIRRKAIALMRAAKWQEGIWNSELIAVAAENIIEAEEEELDNPKSCEDVPDWARIVAVDPTLDPDGRRAILRYFQRGKPGAQRKMVEKIVEW